jgi:hypothetical protein
MKASTLSRFMPSIWKGIRKHSPEILTILGITGFTTAAVMAVKVTPKALETVRQDSQKNHDGDRYAYTKKEAVKSAWKCYVPAVGMGLASASCLIFATSTNLRRNAALAAAYSISESTLRDYQAKTLELVGEEKEHEIRDAVIKERVEREPIKAADISVSDDETLCYDPWSGSVFKSTTEKIMRAANNVSRDMLCNGADCVSLNEFYWELGRPSTKSGEVLGWRVETGRELISPIFSAQLTEDGKPCLVIDFVIEPTYGFDV